MTITELNPKGNFDNWDASKLKEIERGQFSDAVAEALYEDERIILWEIVLEPFERLPFRRHINNYSCTAFTDCSLLIRNVNGKISLLRMAKGDHCYVECHEQEIIQDLENIGENAIKIAVVEEKVKIVHKIKK
ncbi:MAG: hypothetical protein AB8B59_15675 [Maribacter sp.]